MIVVYDNMIRLIVVDIIMLLHNDNNTIITDNNNMTRRGGRTIDTKKKNWIPSARRKFDEDIANRAWWGY